MRLDLIQCRVLGCLIEKEITTPENYPLSLNALVNAANQKSSRDPVLTLTESDVRTALFDLDALGLARNVPGDRVPKYEHRVRDTLQLRRDEVAVLCLLLLRGPQTPGELRTRADRMYSFDDLDAVIATLNRLAARIAAEGPGPLVVQLPRQPGAREARFMHLLAGPPDEQTLAGTAPITNTRNTEVSEACETRFAELESKIEALTQRITELESKLR